MSDTVASLHAPLLNLGRWPKRHLVKGFSVKPALPLFAAAACLLSAPAFAQGPSGQYDAGLPNAPDLQVTGFIRIPLGDGGQKEQEPRIGFGVFSDCHSTAARLSSEQRSSCESQPIRSLEVTRHLSERNWLFSFTNDKRWVGIARLYPDGFGTVREFGPVLSEPALEGPLD